MGRGREGRLVLFLFLLPWPRLPGSLGVSAPEGTSCGGSAGRLASGLWGLAAPARGWWVWGVGPGRHAELTAGNAAPRAVVEILVLGAVVAAWRGGGTEGDGEAPLPCLSTPSPLPLPEAWMQGPLCHTPRLRPRPPSGRALSAGRTFGVGVWEALRVPGAEARLVVPRAAGLLAVLVCAVPLSVGVVEVTVDGWEKGLLSGPRRAGQGARARTRVRPGEWARAGHSRQKSGVLQSTHTPLSRQALA